tara:strand:- start:1441 stop:2826 length:1386 start_codon:yes stop_codon:yes gene_type:complete
MTKINSFLNTFDIVVLAAGKGSRMKSRTLSKPMHLLNGVTLIEYLLLNLPLKNLNNKIAVVPANYENIKSKINDVDNEFVYVVQNKPKGTGDALFHALTNLKSKYVLVVNSDVPLITQPTYLNLMNNHEKNNLTLSFIQDNLSDTMPGDFGIVLKSNDGKIKSINEKSRTQFESANANALQFNVGVYCFDVQWLREFLPNLKTHSNGEKYITDLVEIAYQQGLNIDTYYPQNADESIGINDNYELNLANNIARMRKNQQLIMNGVTIVDPLSTYIDYKSHVAEGTIIHPGTHIKEQSIIGKDCEIGPNAELHDSLVGNNSIINNSVIKKSKLGKKVHIGPFSYIRQFTEIKDNVFIGTNVEIKNSIIKSKAKLGHYCYIGDSVIGELVNIGAGTVTCNYDGYKKHKTNIKAKAFIGSGTMIVAPITINEGAKIGAGSVLTKDVDKNSLVYGVPAKKIRELS